jgi:hypothetical protein
VLIQAQTETPVYFSEAASKMNHPEILFYALPLKRQAFYAGYGKDRDACPYPLTALSIPMKRSTVQPW